MDPQPLLADYQPPPKYIFLTDIKFHVYTLPSDSRFKFTIYVPKHLFHASIGIISRGAQRTSTTTHTTGQRRAHAVPKGLPLVVFIHSIGRDAESLREDLIAFAEKHGVCILAPFFPAELPWPTVNKNVKGSIDGNNYPYVRHENVEYDNILLGILAELALICTGIDCEKCTFIGFSMGASFIHRFAYAHPERVKAMCLIALTDITTISTPSAWPKGTVNFTKIFEGRKLDLQAIRDIENILLLVGEDPAIRSVEAFEEFFRFARRVDESQRNGNLASSGPNDAPVVENEGWKKALESMTVLQKNWLELRIVAKFRVIEGRKDHHVRVVRAMIEWLATLFPQK